MSKKIQSTKDLLVLDSQNVLLLSSYIQNPHHRIITRHSLHRIVPQIFLRSLRPNLSHNSTANFYTDSRILKQSQFCPQDIVTWITWQPRKSH